MFKFLFFDIFFKPEYTLEPSSEIIVFFVNKMEARVVNELDHPNYTYHDRSTYEVKKKDSNVRLKGYLIQLI